MRDTERGVDELINGPSAARRTRAGAPLTRCASLIGCALLISCTLLIGCTMDGATTRTADDVDVEGGDPVDGSTAIAPTVTRTNAIGPSQEDVARVTASLPRPYTVTMARTAGGESILALARREDGAWTLVGSFDRAELEGCERFPCPWPASLTPVEPLTEAPALTGEARDAAGYLQALLTFEDELNVMEEDADQAFVEQLPEGAMGDPMNADLAAFLEPLRRYHPVGMCSMDQSPQIAAMMRAVAAAQAGHTGWAVQGWMDTVSYWSSQRVAWSSYGQDHPADHFAILDMVHVDRRRVLIGALLDVPGSPRVLGLADARRVVSAVSPDLQAAIRALANDPSVDPFDQARLFASVASLPLTEDPEFEALSPTTRMIVERWSR